MTTKDLCEKLNSLDRYDFDYNYGMEVYNGGDYIKVNDIAHILGLQVGYSDDNGWYDKFAPKVKNED